MMPLTRSSSFLGSSGVDRSRCESAGFRPSLTLTAVLLFLLVVLSGLAYGQHEFRVLHAFGAGGDGAGVWDSVALDKKGNIYGTTSGGGKYAYGTVFQLSPRAGGSWAELLLLNFKSGDPRGDDPNGGLVVDASGNVYGSTDAGGAQGAGTIFKLSPSGHRWAFALLYSFGDHDLACCPRGSLILDSGGNLYGTGASAFELSPGREGWTETILHEFTGNNGDGVGPYAGPIRDTVGNLYGTTLYGGGSKECDDGCGTVWELSPPASGRYTEALPEHILYRFGFSGNQAFPGVGQLAMDPQGNLYGAVEGGKYRAGIIYKLSPASPSSSSNGPWQETILYNFTGGEDGGFPEGVILDQAGNLYGICGVGGKYGQGTVFKMSPQTDHSWKYTLLHTFNGYDGAEPAANLTLGPDGKLYGTAATGGRYGGGVVFQLTP